MDTLKNLQDSVTTNVTTAVNDQLTKMFTQYIVPVLIILGIVVLLGIFRAVHRYRVDRAIFEIRDTLRAQRSSTQQIVRSDTNQE